MFTTLTATVDRPRRRAVTVSPNGAPDHRVDNPGRYAAALAHAGRRVDVRRPGVGTVSAPRSVSSLYAGALGYRVVGIGRGGDKARLAAAAGR